MAQFNADDFERPLAFFILSGFSNGPRSVSEIQQHVNGVERLLDWAAARKGKLRLGSLPAALERLLHEGWLRLVRLDEPPGPEAIYMLTDAGEQRLEQERARLHSIVAQFVENGEPDGSFRTFLNSQSPLWSNW